MRVLFVTPEFVTEEDNYDGGLANYVYRISISLKDRGHKPIVVVASRKQGVVFHDGIEVHRVRVVWFKRIVKKLVKFLPGLDWWLASHSLNQEVNKINSHEKIDIVQYASVGATALCRDKMIPSVVRLSGYQKLWDVAYEEKVTLARSIYQRLEQKALKRADAVFGPSKLISEYIYKDTGISVKVIESPFILDVGELEYSVYDEISKELRDSDYILFFGSLGLAKGIRTIADACFDLFSRNPNLSLVLIGKDLGYRGKPILNYVRDMAKNHANKVIYRNRLRHSQLYPIIQHAKLVVLPSRIDNLPNTCIEAMAFKKIVIGTKGSSFEQLIDDGVNGFLCEKDNPDDLLEAITRAMQLTDHEASCIGENAYNRIAELSPERIVQHLTEFYDDVIRGKNCGV